jgi:type III restriction enzyme
VIFLIEARGDFRQGIHVPPDLPGEFVRYACKMATGAGKTTVMAALAAWSILNKVADRGDRRFSDVVLVVCPNVTIRDRLQELDPHRGEASLYRTRDLVPSQLMSDLRPGHVLLRNWHGLAPLELNQVGGVGARVVQRGRESDTALVARVLGREVGGKGHVLVLNDEAHHAYGIRRDGGDGDDEGADEDELAEADRREATVWIEGLDRIHRVRGINLCVDLSATPFYLTRSGNDPGRPFPWVVSDFGLIDAIESGLVKIPQLPVQDASGREIPVYFHLWKWIVEEKLSAGERGGRRGQVRPEAVLRWAQQPIAQLAGLWREEFVRWRDEAARGARPPVFIVVCRDTRLARAVHEWLTGTGSGAAPPIDEFRNTETVEYTVRIDSRVVEELSSGVARSDESRRLRFVLDTIGRTAWSGDRPPEEYVDLVERLNRKAVEEGHPAMDPRVPPGRDVRCIVSVAMLTEGWDATTVTHIVGLRPFESQLLCEQVIGRGLRRSQYHDLTVEEVAQVYGVPFELIPLKATPGVPAPPPRVHHVHAVSPARDHLAISFPRVEGYAHAVSADVRIAWERVPEFTLDPQEIPDAVKVKGLSTDREGRLSLLGPGATDEVTLAAWRRNKRLQELEFRAGPRSD